MECWAAVRVQQTEGTKDGEANVQGFFFSFFGDEKKGFGTLVTKK